MSSEQQVTSTVLPTLKPQQSQSYAHRKKPVTNLQPPIFLGCPAFYDLGDIDAVVSWDMLVSNAPSNAEPQSWKEKIRSEHSTTALLLTSSRLEGLLSKMDLTHILPPMLQPCKCVHAHTLRSCPLIKTNVAWKHACKRLDSPLPKSSNMTCDPLGSCSA